MPSFIEAAKNYLKMGWAVVPTLNKKCLCAYTQLPKLKKDSQECINLYLHQFEQHPEAQGIALIIDHEMVVLDLDSERAVSEYSAIFEETVGIKTHRGAKYIFQNHTPDLIDTALTLRQRAGSAKFHIKEDVEIILEGMLCEIPPGLHPSGQPYEWIKEPKNGCLTTLPRELYEAIIEYRHSKQQRKGLSKQELDRLLKGVSEGERNEAGIKIAGHLIGKNNTWTVVVDSLRSWNQRNKPPLDNKELEGVIESARRYYDEKASSSPTPEKGITETKELTIEEIRERKEDLKDRRLPLVLPPSHFVSIYCNWLSGLTDGYIDYQSISALWLISSFCNYNVSVRLKQETVRPNISITILGKSTISRKSTVVNKARQIHESVTGKYLPNEDFSIEGYLESLAMDPTQHHVRDEVAGFMAKIHKPYNEGFNELECALYDGQNFRKTLASRGKSEPKSFEIKNPYVTKLYATTPDNYFKYMEIEDFVCGKEFRTIFVYPTYQKPRMALSTETEEDINNWFLVLQRAKAIYNFIKESNEINFSFGPGALDLYSEITLKIEEVADKADNSILSSAVGRSQIHILKLAMLIELGKEQISTTITKESIAIAANTVISYFLPVLMNVIDEIQEDTKNNMVEKVLAVIRRHGGAVQHSVALHKSKIKSRDFAEVINTLIESEVVEKVIETKSEKFYYILTEQKKSLDLSIFQSSIKNSPNSPNSPIPSFTYKQSIQVNLENLKNIKELGILCIGDFDNKENKESLSCEVQQSNNYLILQNSPAFLSVGEEVNSVNLVNSVNSEIKSCVVSEEEALNILEEEGF